VINLPTDSSGCSELYCRSEPKIGWSGEQAL